MSSHFSSFFPQLNKPNFVSPHVLLQPTQYLFIYNPIKGENDFLVIRNYSDLGRLKGDECGRVDK